MRLFLILILAAPALFAAPQGNNKKGFRVKKYHLKSEKNIWDAKTSVLNAQGNVVTSLYLEDGTTAYIYSDFATDDRLKQTGKAWGNASFIWQDLTVHSSEITFDANFRKVVFSKKGDLVHKNFMRGKLEMNFTKMTDKLDAKDYSYLTATDAKGVWTPLPQPAAPVSPVKKKGKKK